MFGQGSPQYSGLRTGSLLILVVFLVSHSIGLRLNGSESAEAMRLRLSFGGPEKAVWKGQIEFAEGTKLSNIRILGIQPDHAGRIYFKKNRLVIDLVEPTVFGGVEFEVEGAPTDQLKYSFDATQPNAKPESLFGQVLLGELVSKPLSAEMSQTTNRIYLERAPGDDLKFILKGNSLVLNPTQKLSFGIAVSKFIGLDETVDKKLVAKIVKRDVEPVSGPLWQDVKAVNESGKSVLFELDELLPSGIYDLSVDLTEPSTIPFAPATNLSSRTIQFIIPETQPAEPVSDSPESYVLVYEREGNGQEYFPRRRFRQIEKFNASAKRILRNLPIPNGKNGNQTIEISPDSLRLFPLQTNESQVLHKLEVEYQCKSDVAADLVLFDRDTPNSQLRQVTSTSVQLKGNLNQSGPRKVQLLFWNRSSSPILMIRNIKSEHKLHLTGIRVYRFENRIEEFKLYTNRSRRLFAQFSPAQFAEILSAPKLMSTQGYAIDDWNTIRTGGTRLVQLVKAARYQGVVIDVNEQASGLYPSRLMQFSPKWDTGIFAPDGMDPVRKDILELLFRQFTANGLTLIPRVEIPEWVAAFERSELNSELRLIQKDGEPTSTYNHLHPHVQAYLSEIVFELIRRYDHHASFGGICLNIGKNQQLILNKEQGFNPKLINKFIESSSKVLPKEIDDDEKKRNHIATKFSSEYRDWQIQQNNRFLTQLNESIKKEFKTSLVLDFSTVRTSMAKPFVASGLRSGPQKEEIDFHEIGFSSDELRKSGIGVFGFNYRSASMNLASQKLVHVLMQQTLGSKDSPPFHSQVRQIQRRREIANHQVKDTTFENVGYLVSVPDSNLKFRRDLISSLAKNDVLFFLDDFELDKRVNQGPSARIWNTFSNLPNIVFETVTKNEDQSPVIVRKKTIGNESFLYVINQSPWPTQVSIKFATPLVNLRGVTGEFFSTLEKNETGGVLSLALEPYDLIAGRSDQKELKISEVKFSFPESLKQELSNKKDRLLAKIRFLKTPAPISKDANASFENTNSDGLPQDWTQFQSESFKVTSQADDAVDGKLAIEITNNSGKEWGWLRTQPLQNNGTGRISLLVSMKSKSGSVTPKIRLCIDGQAEGKDYYRFGSFSASKETIESARITEDWKVFAVHFNDVPVDIDRLRVGIDVIGQGSVLVDDLRVFDRWFDNQDKEALSKIVSLAAHNLSTGEFLKAHRLMESYWPRFIQEYTVE